MSKNFLCPIFIKLKIRYPCGLRILQKKFEWNRRLIFFLTEKGPFGFFQKIEANFQIDHKSLGAPRPLSRSQIIISLSAKVDFDLVSDGPMFPGFLAGLQEKLSTGGRGGFVCGSKFSPKDLRL